MNEMTKPKVHAIIVNHNTSQFTELALRSIIALHSDNADLAISVFDNASTDDTESLIGYATQHGITFQQTGYSTQTKNVSHGDALNRFVRENPDADYYLFLDADTCFIQPGTLELMLRELSEESQAWGIGARQSWDAKAEVPPGEDNRQKLYHSRLHPCCALVRNTELFRSVVSTVGFSCVQVLHPNHEEYLDTAELLTRVMWTHNLRHIISSTMVLHFFCVSYDPQYMEQKVTLRDKLLSALRAGEKERFFDCVSGSFYQ